MGWGAFLYVAISDVFGSEEDAVLQLLISFFKFECTTTYVHLVGESVKGTVLTLKKYFNCTD